jgi:predicted transcriptional regulator
MSTKVIKVGIMPYEKFKQYTFAIACGKHKPRKNAPKIWFESIETMSQVLSTRNVELLKIIEKQKPQSMKELANVSGRAMSNLSRTLKTFRKYGIVDLIQIDRRKVPVAKATSFSIEYGKKYPFFEDQALAAKV